MILREWDGLAPLAAAAALAVLALMPDRPASGGPRGDAELAVLEQAAAGEEVPWTDPVSGRQGALVAAEIWQDSQGQWCRDYSLEWSQGRQRPLQPVADEGWQLAAAGASTVHVACRRARGEWHEMPNATATDHHLIGAPPGSALSRLVQRPEQTAAVDE